MKKRGFKMKSGNNPEFKEMGSSPHKFLGGFGQTLKKGFNALTGLGKDGNEAQGVEGTIATGEQKAGLEGGMMSEQMGKAIKNSKQGRQHEMLHKMGSGEGGFGGEATRDKTPNLQPSAFGKVTYAQAKAKDPNLDKYIAKRKKYNPGSDLYEALQRKINAAYSTKRSQKLKAAQIAKVNKKETPKKETPKKEKTTRKEYVPQTVSPRKEYDPASRNKRKEYIPQSQR